MVTPILGMQYGIGMANIGERIWNRMQNTGVTIQNPHLENRDIFQNATKQRKFLFGWPLIMHMAFEHCSLFKHF